MWKHHIVPRRHIAPPSLVGRSSRPYGPFQLPHTPPLYRQSGVHSIEIHHPKAPRLPAESKGHFADLGSCASSAHIWMCLTPSLFLKCFSSLASVILWHPKCCFSFVSGSSFSISELQKVCPSPHLLTVSTLRPHPELSKDEDHSEPRDAPVASAAIPSLC